MAVQRGRSQRRGESYSLPYGEPLSVARTKLADFFNILLERICPFGKAARDSRWDYSLISTRRMTRIFVPSGQIVP